MHQNYAIIILIEYNHTKIEELQFQSRNNNTTSSTPNRAFVSVNDCEGTMLTFIALLIFFNIRVTTAQAQMYPCYTHCVCNNTRVKCHDQTLEIVNSIAKQIATNTTYLSFASCWLTSFPWEAFNRQLPALEELDLSHNYLSRFPGSDISNTKNISKIFSALKIIDVSHNELTEFSIQHLGEVPLVKLFASSNKISMLYSTAFQTFQDLEELHLDRNKLSDLPSFTGLKNLKMLQLTENKLQHLKGDTFKGLENLTVLNISSNMIKMVETNVLRHFKNDSIVISFANNNIQEIQEGFFESLKKLKSISFERNEISSLGKDVFSGITVTDKKAGINLQSNSLESLPIDAFRGMSGGIVLLYRNPIRCDCDVYKLMRFFNQTNNKNISLHGTCSLTQQLRRLENNKISFDSDFSEICPACEIGNTSLCSVEGTASNGGMCYTCSCNERKLYSSRCFLPDDSTLQTCKCSRFIYNTSNNRWRNRDAVSSAPITSYIIVGSLIFIVVAFVVMSFPMHTYCRRRIKKKQLRKLSMYRKRLLSRSSRSSSSSKYECNPDKNAGNGHSPVGCSHVEFLGDDDSTAGCSHSERIDSCTSTNSDVFVDSSSYEHSADRETYRKLSND